MPEEPVKLDETLDAKAYEPSKRGRSLTGFYVALGVVVALALFGGWFWRTWNVWWFDADEARRRQAEAAAKLGVPVEKSLDLGGGITLDLVLIPAGRFKMGSPAEESGRENDEDHHWVIISKPFYMGRHEVTQEQWIKVMGRNPSRFQDSKRPVENITWDEGLEFMKRLTSWGRQVDGAPQQSTREVGRFRFPTEAEWEWACRAGTKTRFCCGDADELLADYAWCGISSQHAHLGDGAYGLRTEAVGTKKPNAWGLWDVHGNVWEWCSDWYGSYGSRWLLRVDPQGPETGEDRVVRGGCYDNQPRYCRSADRDRCSPDRGTSDHALRVAATPGALP